jgi:hypothetical protein
LKVNASDEVLTYKQTEYYDDDSNF